MASGRVESSRNGELIFPHGREPSLRQNVLRFSINSANLAILSPRLKLTLLDAQRWITGRMICLRSAVRNSPNREKEKWPGRLRRGCLVRAECVWGKKGFNSNSERRFAANSSENSYPAIEENFQNNLFTQTTGRDETWQRCDSFSICVTSRGGAWNYDILIISYRSNP